MRPPRAGEQKGKAEVFNERTGSERPAFTQRRLGDERCCSREHRSVLLPGSQESQGWTHGKLSHSRVEKEATGFQDGCEKRESEAAWRKGCQQG